MSTEILNNIRKSLGYQTPMIKEVINDIHDRLYPMLEVEGDEPEPLPDFKVFEITARDAAESSDNDDMINEYLKQKEFRLAVFNSQVREEMFDEMIEKEGIRGGWFWSVEGDFMENGPFKSRDEAYKNAMESRLSPPF